MSARVRRGLHGSFLQSLGLLALIVILGQCASGNPYWVGLFTTATILYILAASLNLVLGYSGLFSLGQQAFYAIGAYVSVLIGIHVTGLPWVVTVLGAAIASGIVGFLLALPTARLRGEYLALATIAFGVGIQEVLITWLGVTGGPNGLSGVPLASVFGHSASPGSQEFLWITGVGAALTFLVSSWMVRSRLGRSLRALRDNPLASQAAGINPIVIRSVAFAASGAMAGLAGALFAAQQLFIEPGQFDFTVVIGILVAVLIGGPGRSIGPVIGAAALTALQKLTSGLGSAEAIVYAALLAAVILLLRDGIIGLGTDITQRLSRHSPVVGGSDLVARADGPLSPTHPPPRAARADNGAVELFLNDVEVRFGGVVALHGASMSVRRGEILGLIGPNGAGKTTLVNVATGVVSPTRGALRLGSETLTGLSPHEASRRGITRTFQHPQLSLSLSVLENAMLGLDRSATATLAEAIFHLPRSRRDERHFRAQAMELLQRVGIDHLADAPAGSVPYGVQRRLEVARALAGSPHFIFLDEAGAGLNDAERAELIDAIHAILAADGPGIVVIEHNIGFVRALCPRSVVLVDGAVLLEGETDAVLADERVIDAYLGRPAAEPEPVAAAPSEARNV
jgi:branched-chain amino acid transport system permease protein